MKKLFLIFVFLISFIFVSQASYAADNYLHSITLEKNNLGYNIILGSDKVTKVSKKIKSDNELVIMLSGITSSDSVNAIYKGTNDVEGLVIENVTPNKLKVYINADNIKNSTVMIDPIFGNTTIVAESVPIDKILWVVFVLALFSVIFKISKDISEEDDRILIKKDIKDREIQLYKKYRSEMSINPVIDVKSSIRMRKMLKKIDRKIDERLTSVIK